MNLQIINGCAGTDPGQHYTECSNDIKQHDINRIIKLQNDQSGANSSSTLGNMSRYITFCSNGKIGH